MEGRAAHREIVSGHLVRNDASLGHRGTESFATQASACPCIVDSAPDFHHVFGIVDEFENLETPRKFLPLRRSPAFHFFKNFGEAHGEKNAQTR